MATLTLTTTKNSIRARVSGLQNIQTYDRTFHFIIYGPDGYSDEGEDYVEAASGVSSVSYRFTGLEPSTTYTVQVVCTRDDTGSSIWGEMSNATTDEDPEQVTADLELYAEYDGVEAHLYNITPVNVSRTFIFTIYQGSTELDSATRIVSANSSSDLYVWFTSNIEPLTQYRVRVASSYGESYSATITTPKRPGAKIWLYNGST